MDGHGDFGQGTNLANSSRVFSNSSQPMRSIMWTSVPKKRASGSKNNIRNRVWRDEVNMNGDFGHDTNLANVMKNESRETTFLPTEARLILSHFDEYP